MDAHPGRPWLLGCALVLALLLPAAPLAAQLSVMPLQGLEFGQVRPGVPEESGER